jgi:tRNA (cytidine/uridine-2'-O-)-methyltransferase
MRDDNLPHRCTSQNIASGIIMHYDKLRRIITLDPYPQRSFDDAMLNLVLVSARHPAELSVRCLRLSCLPWLHDYPCGGAVRLSRSTRRKLRRAGMDYIDQGTVPAPLTNWGAFLAYRAEHPGRLMLLETDGAVDYSTIQYSPSDYVVLGRESAGTPRALYDQMDMLLTIPMREGVRSLNMAMSAGILTAEACRQMQWQWKSEFPCTTTVD